MSHTCTGFKVNVLKFASLYFDASIDLYLQYVLAPNNIEKSKGFFHFCPLNYMWYKLLSGCDLISNPKSEGLVTVS